jgi:hypothetical protein
MGQFSASVQTLNLQLSRVHDIMDEEIIDDNPPKSDWRAVMTTRFPFR